MFFTFRINKKISKLLFIIILILSIIIIGVKIRNKNNFTISVNAEVSYIKWIDFNIPYEILKKTMDLDIKSHQTEGIQYNWIEILSYLSCKYGGDFKQYKEKDLTDLIKKLNNNENIEELSKNMKQYSYYKESYTAILGGFIGETENTTYGLKVFSPIARGYWFEHYDDFGNSRSYGYDRKHLGHDLMGNIGTPIIAIESGIIEELGWNQYGGWRIGIRSLDQKRYYYYAHMRKDHPYNKELVKGNTIKAGDVIGYLGRTGYSTTENVNNINENHLHLGLQIIFDESQKEGTNQIWINMYDITKLLQQNKSKVIKNAETKDYHRIM